MRTILMLGIGAVLTVACTTEPERPESSPPTVCAERCETDADCGEGGACCTDPALCGADHGCVACTSDAQCGGGACVGGSCVECASDADCKGNPHGSFCSPENTCGECASDEQCSGNPAGGRCAPTLRATVNCDVVPDESCAPRYTCLCATNADCKEPGLGLCRAGGCVCSDDSGCTTGAQKCDAVLGLCYGCEDDSQCEDGKSKCFGEGSLGAYCGCKTDAECDPAVDGHAHCTEDSGLCVACTKDAHCDDGRVCVNPGMPNADCGCTKDAHCAGSPFGPVCNAATGACQQCLTADDCQRQKLGSVCTPEGQCSCNDQSECGAEPSAPRLEWVCE